VHVGEEPIAASRHRFDEAGRTRAILQRLTQLGHRDVHAGVELDERVVGPQRASYILARDNRSGTRHQQCQQPRGLILERHLPSLFEERSGGEIELERAESDQRRLSWQIRHVFFARILASSDLPSRARSSLTANVARAPFAQVSDRQCPRGAARRDV